MGRGSFGVISNEALALAFNFSGGLLVGRLCDVGPDLREGKLGSCPGPPQLGGLHKNSKKIITQGNIKILFETDNLE